MRLLKPSLALLLMCLGLSAMAQTGFVRLTTYPTMSVADARSTVNVTAEVRDSSGKTVPDGTPVVFDSTLGNFRETVLKTASGVVHATLVAPGFPGTAKITASCLTFNATAVQEFEFVSDRSLLSSAKEYVEIVAPGYMMYATDTKIVAAAGPNRGVHLRYRDVEIDADDLQFNIQLYEVRARKARMKIGKQSHDYGALYIKLNSRKGFGTTTYTAPVVTNIVSNGDGFAFTTEEHERYGLAEIRASGLSAVAEQPPANNFEFADLTQSVTLVSAKKAVIFPRKEIQFQKAEILVNGNRMLKMPLFDVSLNGGTPVLTDNIVGINNNALSINYPHYLSLKPGETSLLRFRMGQSYGRTYSGAGGAFLDYEMNWNKGDDLDGGLVFSGIGRNDWRFDAHQFVRFDDRTSGFAQLDVPSGRSLFGSSSLSRQYDGFQLSLTGNANHAIRGLRYDTQQYAMTLEKDPTKVGKMPLRVYYGLTATENDSRTAFATQSQTAAGLRARAQLLPQRIDRDSTLNASFSAARLVGHNALRGLTLIGDLSVSRKVGKDLSLVFGYDFADDGFNSNLVGKHRLSVQGYYSAGRASVSAFGARSLDIDRFNYTTDVGYRFSGLWSFRYSNTYDRYLGSNFLDTNLMLGYRYGWRELGLVWSRRTHRFGIQVLGATID